MRRTSQAWLLPLLLCHHAAALALAPRRLHLIVNPYGGGGTGLATLEAVLPIFARAGCEVTTLVTEYAGHAGEYARTVPLLDGFVGIGGDGTAHEICNGMLRRPEAERVPVGIVPSGSGNTWAFDLGLRDAETAARTIADGQTTRVDAIAVDDIAVGAECAEYAINICAAGMPAAVLAKANELRALTGPAQYELAGLALLLLGQASFSATLEIEAPDGARTTRELDDYSFAQAQVNMHMGKKVCFAPGADMADGLLDLVLVRSSRALDVLHAIALARGAAHVQLPFVEVVRCRSYKLTPRRVPAGLDASAPQINLDGELTDLGRSAPAPFRARCVPRAIEVFASRLNSERVDTSGGLEPRLVLALVALLARGRVVTS